MKRKVITCDICGKDMTTEDIRYKGRLKEYKNTYANQENFDFQKWTRLDVCNNCMFEFVKFIKRSDSNAE